MAETESRSAFRAFATMYGLTAADLDREFTDRMGKRYRLIGLNLKARKYPFEVLRLDDNTPMKYTREGVKEALER